MNKNDFIYEATHQYFVANINGIEICINDKQITDNILSLAEKILSGYHRKIAVISEYLSKDKCFVFAYGNITKEEISQKLHEPNITIDKDGGLLTYCNHEFDDVHIIDIEFSGVLEEFYNVSIDG